MAAEAPSSSSHPSQAPPSSGLDLLAGVAEMSPNKRYLRFEEVLASSGDSLHLSYRAFDTKNGIELAWHTISLNALSESEQKQITQCVNIIKNVDNKNIIEYLACWFGSETRTLNIITTHLDTLQEFISKVMTLRWRIVKKWCKQILRALDHLHTSKPQIVHRNITCSHIYIDGGVGATTIGDLWMAAVLADDPANPIGLSEALTRRLGQYSPASTAPETLDSQPLTTKVDIYAFGMCVLEIIAREEPYSEFQGSLAHAKIRYCAVKGVLPRVLGCVAHGQAKEFILACLRAPHERPSAAELLQHAFLAPLPEDDEEVVLRETDGAGGQAAEAAEALFDTDDFRAFCANWGGDTASATLHASSDAQAAAAGGAAAALSHPAGGGGGGGGGGSAIIAEGCASGPNGPVPASETGPTGHDQAASTAAPTTQPPAAAADLGSDLALELAHLEQGENVHQDKGVHDGRRAEEEVNSDEGTASHDNGSAASQSAAAAGVAPAEASAAPPETLETPRLEVPPEQPASHSAPPAVVIEEDRRISLVSLSRNPACASELRLMIKIPMCLTLENVSKEVEFMLDLVADKCENVAAEMIEELGLTLSVSDLTQQMEALIQQAGDVGVHQPSDFEAFGAAAGAEAEGGTEALGAAAPTSTDAHPSPHADSPTDDSEPSPAAGPPDASLSPDLESMLEAEYGKLDNESDVHAEMDKVDKESRVSRRAFEQRIEKHKIIQEKCDEDLWQLDSDYQLKKADLQRKEESAVKKRAEELARIAAETEAALEVSG